MEFGPMTNHRRGFKTKEAAEDASDETLSV
jgi:hypothetical protein